jgi:hypothetical protein
MLVSDADEAVLLSNLRPCVSGRALKRSRRNARFASDDGCPILLVTSAGALSTWPSFTISWIVPLLIDNEGRIDNSRIR